MGQSKNSVQLWKVLVEVRPHGNSDPTGCGALVNCCGFEYCTVVVAMCADLSGRLTDRSYIGAKFLQA